MSFRDSVDSKGDNWFEMHMLSSKLLCQVFVFVIIYILSGMFFSWYIGV